MASVRAGLAQTLETAIVLLCPEDVNSLTRAEYMQFRTQLAALNLPKTLPVGTADAGSAFTNANTLAAGSDFIMANVS